MRKIFTLITALTLSLFAMAQNTTPLLDRELFFGNPEITGGQISPDGKWISFMKAYDGIMNIWVKSFDQPFEAARPLTDSKRPLYGYFWSRDSKYILYVKDKDGDENINIYAVSPLSIIKAGKVPDSRNLTPLKEVTAQINMVSMKNHNLLYVSINDRDKAWHDLYTLTIDSGKLTKIYENKDRITGFDFDNDEKLRALSKTDEKGNTTLYRIDPNQQLTPVYDFNVNEQAYITGFTPDNKEAYFVTNKGKLDKSELFLFNLESKKLTKLESDPKNEVDFGGIITDKNTHQLLGTYYTRDKTEFHWKDKKWKDMYEFLQSKFPGREVGFASSNHDYSKFLVSVGGDKYASEAYFFDATTKELKHQYTPRPKLKEVEQYLAPMKAVRYKSSDGLEIPAYLTIPVGSNGKNLPVVMLIHGGPKGPRDYWGYDPEAQFLANRGYAVLQPNFRASGGYGKKFLNAGDLQWGKLMQDDITYGVHYLVKEGIADKSKVAIMGGSYGGYATLAGLAFTPDLYACGVDIVGPSNIFTLLESVPAYWESGRAFLYGMVGDPNTEEGKKRIREASPLFSVDKIVKPLLVVQGANDPRVKQAEADQIVIALRDKGKKVEYLLAKDEGHGFSKPLNKMAMYAATEKFLAGVVGGRYQKEMPQDVADQLAKITVDIKEVELHKKIDEKVASSLPAIKNNLKEGTYPYKGNIAAQGQNIPFTTIRTIKKENNSWVVRDVTEGAFGSIVDEVKLNKDLQLTHRNIEQGGSIIPVTFTKDALEASFNGVMKNVKFTGAYLVDGPGGDVLLSGMPIKKGFSLVYEQPDLNSMKTKTMKMTCFNEETINNQPCWKVESVNVDNPNDKVLYWINQNTQEVQKTESLLPHFGNAVMTVEKQ